MSAAECRIVVQKAARTLLVYEEARLALSYPVVLGRNWAEDKAIEGDEATPLGEFYICAKNPRSRFFLSMCISYPNAEHAQRGLAANLITREQHADILAAIHRRGTPPQHTRLGGEICIHGRDPAQSEAGTQGGTGPRSAAAARNGTRGCIALDNAAMQELYDRTLIGTPVVIIE